MGFQETATRLDIFGQDRGFSIDSREKYKTFLGMICTLFLVLLCFGVGGMYTYRFIYREENPTIKSKNAFSPTPPRLDLKNLNFVFSITGFVENNTVVMPEELMRTVSIKIGVSRRFVNSSNAIEEQFKVLETRPCRPEDFELAGKSLIDKPQLKSISYSVCTDMSKIQIDGEDLGITNQFMKILVEPCKQNCRPDHATIIAFKNLKLKLGYSHTSVVEGNFGDPFKYFYITNSEFPCLYSKSFQRKFFIRRVDVHSDLGIFQENWVYNSSANLYKSFVEDRVRAYEDPFIALEFYSSHHLLEYKRAYNKIPDMLSGIGGIVTIFINVIRLLYKSYNKMKLKLHLLNKTLLRTSKKDHVESRRLYPKDMLAIYIYKGLTKIKVPKKWFSEKLRKRASLFKGGNVRINQHLEIKNIINCSRDIQLFKRIFFNKYHNACLDLLEMNSLLINDTEYLDHREEWTIKNSFFEFFRQSSRAKTEENVLDYKLNLFFDKYIDELLRGKYKNSTDFVDPELLEDYKKMKKIREEALRQEQKKKRILRALSAFRDGQNEENVNVSNVGLPRGAVDKRIRELNTIMSKISHNMMSASIVEKDSDGSGLMEVPKKSNSGRPSRFMNRDGGLDDAASRFSPTKKRMERPQKKILEDDDEVDNS